MCTAKKVNLSELDNKDEVLEKRVLRVFNLIEFIRLFQIFSFEKLYSYFSIIYPFAE